MCFLYLLISEVNLRHRARSEKSDQYQGHPEMMTETEMKSVGGGVTPCVTDPASAKYVLMPCMLFTSMNSNIL